MSEVLNTAPGSKLYWYICNSFPETPNSRETVSELQEQLRTFSSRKWECGPTGAGLEGARGEDDVKEQGKTIKRQKTNSQTKNKTKT